MFCLPACNEELIEGSHEGRPVVLEGYQAADFDALLKVLYPTYATSIVFETHEITVRPFLHWQAGPRI
jgi:hypothetical protein